MNLLTMQGSIELGIIYSIMALGVFISFRTLEIPDMTVDGSFVLGAAVSAVLCMKDNPILGILFAIAAGSLAGCITALLHTKLNIQPLLAGILTMLALYSINLKVMDKKPNISLLNKKTIYNVFDKSNVADYTGLIISFIFLLGVMIILVFFLKTKLGLALRATGDNEYMVRALGTNTDMTKIIGLAISNGLVALSGALIAQYQCFSDVSMGLGMVTVGLASVIIGEVVFGIKSLIRRLVAVILGAILYRLIVAFAFDLGMPPNDLKLVSAVIVTIALSMTTIRKRFILLKKRIGNV